MNEDLGVLEETFEILASNVKVTPNDLDIMALTLYGECRGEPFEGQQGVAWVIRNRVENPTWWSREPNDGIPDDTIAAVCKDPFQFSCWNVDDRQYKLLKDPATKNTKMYLHLRQLAKSVLQLDKSLDVTHDADHYCTVKVAPSVKWTKTRTPVARIGNHLFYKLGKRS